MVATSNFGSGQLNLYIVSSIDREILEEGFYSYV